MDAIVKFEPVRQEIALWEQKNEELVFDYESKDGEKDARSHCHKLRSAKTKVNLIHKETKAEYLAACQTIDGERNHCIGRIEKMIAKHMDPLEVKAAKARQIEADRVEAERLEQVRLDDLRLADLKVREDLADAKEAELKEKAENLRVAEAERAAEARKKQNAIDRMRQIDEAAAKEKLDEEKEKLAKARQKFAAEQQKVADEKAKQILAIKAEEKKRQDVADAEKKKAEDAKHREEVHEGIRQAIDRVGGQACNIEGILDAIVTGNIPHVQVVY